MKSEVFSLIRAEQKRQQDNIELIASENFVSREILDAVGSCLTNKYAEGYPYERTSGNTGRYYGGTQHVDAIEEYCCDKWREVFQTNYHVNVQPHCGSAANMAAYMALAPLGSTILSMSLDCGGHLSHGAKVSFSGKQYQVFQYGTDSSGYIDYEHVRQIAKKCRPAIIVAGASAYSRKIDFDAFKYIAEEVGAYLVVDMAHIAGLVATGYHASPFGLADIITTTTHKTLRGPRGGMIFCKPNLAKKVDSAVFPGIQGGPLMHVIAGKAICAEEALQPTFKRYIGNVVLNSKAMADEFSKLGYSIVSGGTDNHLFLVDLTSIGISGKQAQDELDRHLITLNKNAIPNDPRPPKETSGIRIGTAAMTTKGYTKDDFVDVAHKIDNILRGITT